MTQEKLSKLEIWHTILSEIQKEYPGSINVDTAMKNIMARINHFNKNKK